MSTTRTIRTFDLLKLDETADEARVLVICVWSWEGPQEANEFKGEWDCTGIQVFTMDGRTEFHPPEHELARMIRNCPRPEANR